MHKNGKEERTPILDRKRRRVLYSFAVLAVCVPWRYSLSTCLKSFVCVFFLHVHHIYAAVCLMHADHFCLFFPFADFFTV